jgi:tripartite-type tricarboxylate transporter receptor subunit TctC
MDTPLEKPASAGCVLNPRHECRDASRFLIDGAGALRLPLLAALFAACGILGAAPASAADFYQGKTINLVIGHSAGGGYDLYARVLARYLGRHIPGNPAVIPVNMPGAGSLRAANYLYAAAPKDGTAIATFSRGMAIMPLLASAHFDGRQFTWLGSITTDVSVCIAWAASGIRSWDDMTSRPFVVGGEAAGSDPNYFALMFKNLLGAKIKLVSGYPGTNDITLAMERGEVAGLCGISWSTVKSRHADWIASNNINVLVQAGFQKEPDLPEVPMATDLVKGTEEMQILRLLLTTHVMARPFAAPPEIPADRKDILRKAFDMTMNDPEFRAEASRLQLDVNPISGASIDAHLEEVYATPRDVVERAAKVVNE